MQDSHSVQDDAPISASIDEELIAWSVRLYSGLATQQEIDSFTAWRNQNPLHETAWRKLQALEKEVQNLGQLRAETHEIALQTLGLASEQRIRNVKRRRSLKLLGIAVLGILSTALLTSIHAPWQQQAYYSTAVGKKENVVLADGTRLLLNTNSQVDVKFTLLKREILLRFGEIYIETGKDTDSLLGRRSFWVKTPEAGLEAIGTRFSVNQSARNTRLHVSEGIVAIHAGAQAPAFAYAQDTYTISDGGNQIAKHSGNALDIDPMGWVDGVLVAKQMRLQEFVAELARYQTTPITCAENAKDLTVSGVFQLNRADPIHHALNAISRTLPVNVEIKADAINISKKPYPQ